MSSVNAVSISAKNSSPEAATRIRNAVMGGAIAPNRPRGRSARPAAPPAAAAAPRPAPSRPGPSRDRTPEGAAIRAGPESAVPGAPNVPLPSPAAPRRRRQSRHRPDTSRAPPNPTNPSNPSHLSHPSNPLRKREDVRRRSLPRCSRLRRRMAAIRDERDGHRAPGGRGRGAGSQPARPRDGPRETRRPIASVTITRRRGADRRRRPDVIGRAWPRCCSFRRP